MFLLNIKILLSKVKKMNEKPDPARPSRSLTSHFSETMKDGKLKGRELSMRGKCPGGKAPGGLPRGEIS